MTATPFGVATSVDSLDYLIKEGLRIVKLP